MTPVADAATVNRSPACKLGAPAAHASFVPTIRNMRSPPTMVGASTLHPARPDLGVDAGTCCDSRIIVATCWYQHLSAYCWGT